MKFYFTNYDILFYSIENPGNFQLIPSPWESAMDYLWRNGIRQETLDVRDAREKEGWFGGQGEGSTDKPLDL